MVAISSRYNNLNAIREDDLHLQLDLL